MTPGRKCQIPNQNHQNAQSSPLHFNGLVLIKVISINDFQVSCGQCDLKFSSTRSLQQHIKTVHMLEKKYWNYWKDCNKLFTDPSSLRRHQKKHANVEQFQCEHVKTQHKKQLKINPFL